MRSNVGWCEIDLASIAKLLTVYIGSWPVSHRTATAQIAMLDASPATKPAPRENPWNSSSENKTGIPEQVTRRTLWSWSAEFDRGWIAVSSIHWRALLRDVIDVLQEGTAFIIKERVMFVTSARR